MKLTQKQIEELIFEISGNEGLAVYKLLKDKIDVNEFIIAEKLKLTINQVRNIFYKFQAYNLVNSTSRKDRKKGWYIYFFTFNPHSAGSAYLRLKKEKLIKLEQKISKEKAHQFYTCPNKDMRATIENAMEHNFICIECGQLLIPDDNSKSIVKIEYEINQFKNEIQELEKQDVRHAEIEGIHISEKKSKMVKGKPIKKVINKIKKKEKKHKKEKRISSKKQRKEIRKALKKEK